MAIYLLRVAGWALAIAMILTAITKIFQSKESEARLAGQKPAYEVLGGNSANRTSDEFVGIENSFHRLLDTEVQKEQWKEVVRLASILPECGYRENAIQAVLDKLFSNLKDELDVNIQYGHERHDPLPDSELVKAWLVTWWRLIEYLSEPENRSSYLSRLGMMLYFAQKENVVPLEWRETPSPCELERLSTSEALKAYVAEEVQNSPSRLMVESILSSTKSIMEYFAYAVFPVFFASMGNGMFERWGRNTRRKTNFYAMYARLRRKRPK